MELECVDRRYLNVYQPLLQTPKGVAHYLRELCGFPVPSSVLLGRRSQRFVTAIKRFVKKHRIDLIHFRRGERKDDRAQDYLRRCSGGARVLFVGVSQEKAHVVRTCQRRKPNSDSTYPWLMPSTAYVNYYYFYLVDEDFGPFFIKFCSYFPFNAKLCLNGHEYLKRQLAREGIAFEALDNGILSCADPERMQQLADGLTAARIDALLRKWLRRLPHPFSSADQDAGMLYQVSILQAEFSLTQVLDRPLHGRAFFEDVIRENLDLGRPDQVQLIFGRRINKRTPSRYRTRVITQDVVPSLHVDYKHSRIKQYHKEGRALRTETTINDSYDFAIGRRLGNFDQLKELGFSTNRRLLRVQRISHNCQLGGAVFDGLQQPRQPNRKARSSHRRRGETSTGGSMRRTRRSWIRSRWAARWQCRRSAAVWLQGNASSSWPDASGLPATARSKQPDRGNPGYRSWHCTLWMFGELVSDYDTGSNGPTGSVMNRSGRRELPGIEPAAHSPIQRH